MKQLCSIFAMLFVFALVPAEAEAKKFGGGKNFGFTKKTAPAPAPTARPDGSKPAQNTPANSGRKGMLGGLMGGLLAGGLFAALLGSGAFEGIQFMDILIIGLLAFVIFRLFRAKASPQQREPAYSPQPPAERAPFDSNPETEGLASGSRIGNGFAPSEVPFNLPADFDMNGFLAGARDHYRILQDAWNTNDLAKIQEYVTPELYNDLREERATLQGDQHTEVLFVDAELVRADHNASESELSVKFTGRYRDTHEGIEEPITDIWHLQRDLTQSDAPWLIVGIES